MGVEKKVLKTGNGTDKPKAGDTVTMEYTGWLYDPSAADSGFKGNK
jgi:FK506-binding protein 1